jgi:hypothetical protein
MRLSPELQLRSDYLSRCPVRRTQVSPLAPKERTAFVPRVLLQGLQLLPSAGTGAGAASAGAGGGRGGGSCSSKEVAEARTPAPAPGSAPVPTVRPATLVSGAEGVAASTVPLLPAAAADEDAGGKARPCRFMSVVVAHCREFPLDLAQQV